VRRGRHLFGAGGIALITTCVVALMWAATVQSIRDTRLQTTARVEAALTGQATATAAQIDRQIAAIDQMLIQMAASWQADPTHVDLTKLRAQAVAVDGLAKDVLIADENGVIHLSTLPDAIGQGVTGQDYFIALADRTNQGDRLFLGSATISPVLRQWHMNAARRLHGPDGAPAGTIDTDYRIDAITDVLGQQSLGTGGLALLVGLGDGRLRGVVGAPPGDPDVSIGDTVLFGRLKAQDQGIWTGRSPMDALTRIHAFQRIPGRSLAVAVAMDEQEALGPALSWQRNSLLFASGMTVALIAVAWLLIGRVRSAAQAAAAARSYEETLASAQAQTEVYRVVGIARTEQLDTTLDGASDGICVIDGNMCLAEWNDRYAELAGIAPAHLRVGVPLEELLRLQVAAGEFGPVDDPQAEITRQVASLKSRTHAPERRRRPDGRTIEARRKVLPDGGFVTFLTDISDLAGSEVALREARAALGQSKADKAWFMATIAGKARSQAERLLAALQESQAVQHRETPAALISEARRESALLDALADDVATMIGLDAGEIVSRPTLFDPRTLINDVFTANAGAAAEAGVTLQVAPAAELPPLLYADGSLVRRALTMLVNIAVDHGRGGMVLLDARPARSESEGAVFTVRDTAPPFQTTTTDGLFRPAVRPAGVEPEGLADHRLRLSLCGALAALLSAEIGCMPRKPPDDVEGNMIWLALPPQALPQRSPQEDWTPTSTVFSGEAQEPTARRPRTRVLLVEDVPANQIVTATLLRREGHLIDIASSGPEAIEAVRRTPYDLVFMDFLMPGMSGQAAAAAIRKLPEPGRSVPILALTADVLADDEREIRKFGLDGFLSKPVTRAGLLSALNRFVWYRSASPEPMARPVRLTEEDPASRQVLATERLLELRTNLSPETFVRLVEECLLDLDHQLPALRRAMAGGSVGAITAHAHAMVGMAASYGMASLEASLRSILAAVRTDDRFGLGPEAIERVETELAAASRALREMMQDVLA
jgi:CheY-like chemotaxis protein